MAPEDKPREASPPAGSGQTALDPTRLTFNKQLIGEVLNGRYVIQNELKRGGMGVVYLARDQQLHSRPVVAGWPRQRRRRGSSVSRKRRAVGSALR